MNVDSFKNKYIPAEFLEFNPRLYAFVIMLIVGLSAFLIFPVKEISGYIDPFYSPTILILPFVGLYRLTCYAYRKDYNRHIFKHPIGCGIQNRLDSRDRAYTGETSGLFKIENLHRYFLYISILIVPFFYYDFYTSLFLNNAFVLRLGSIFLLLNAIFITLYVLSCHSLRSLIGGRKDCYSCMAHGKGIRNIYDKQSWLNKHHEELAWISLIFIIFVDLYLRGLTVGMPLDFTFFKL